MRFFPLSILVALSACTEAPPTVEFNPTIEVIVPKPEQDEAPTDTVEANDTGALDTDTTDTDVTSDTVVEEPCDWATDPTLTLFNLPAFVAVRSGDGFVLSIPIAPDCGDISVTGVSIDGRFNGELGWLQTFENESSAVDSIGYWRLNAFGVMHYAGRYDGIGYSPGANGTADYLMVWDRNIYSSAAHSTRVRGGETQVMELDFPNISNLFETGRVNMTVWVHFKDMKTGYDTHFIDNMDLVIVD